jgi:hypothetical protein
MDTSHRPLRGIPGSIATLLICLVALAPGCNDHHGEDRTSALPASAAATQPATVEQWSIFEAAFHADAKGNPFDVNLSARFVSDQQASEVRGFYDGDGVYRIRFMPPTRGTWRYQTTSDLPELSGKTGEFICVDPSAADHGPVHPRNVYQFAYADGTPFVPISTTLYGWVNQRSDDLQDQTLATLRASPFNRIRMAVLPISYNTDNVPNYFPFERNADKSWNFSRFDPRFFQHIEKRLGDLRDQGVEAELILFHSRDGGLTKFDRMPAAVDDRYLRYVIARFSCYRNVWWNLANEFDNMRYHTDVDWTRFFKILQAEDPYDHPRSVHQQHRYYDVTEPWVTYMSIQNGGAVSAFGRPESFRAGSQKPVIFDEIEYEGDNPRSWGHLDPHEMVNRFWIGITAGTYVTHGETFYSVPGVAWISRGGKLMGQSPQRIAFLKQVLATAPVGDMLPINPDDTTAGVLGKVGEYYLIYFGENRPTEWTFNLPAGRFVAPGSQYKIDVIDAWNMTITPVDQLAKVPAATTRPSRFASTQPAPPAMRVALPGTPYIALRIQRVP